MWAVGAEVNHQILVSEFDAFSWREGRFADLWPLLGDGMLNIDGPYHRDFRMLMLPAFHRDYVAGVAETMIEEAVAAAESLVEGAGARGLPLDSRARAADRAARPARARRRRRARAGAREGVRGVARDPRRAGPAPAAAVRARDAAGPRDRRPQAGSTRSCARRSRSAGAGAIPGGACSGCCWPPPTTRGRRCPPGVVRDQAVTLLFAGHDTTTTTFTFLLHELGRTAPARQAVEDELDQVLGRQRPDAGRARRAGAAGARADVEGDAAVLSGGVGGTAADDARRHARRRAGTRGDRRPVLVLGHAPPAGSCIPIRSGSTPIGSCPSARLPCRAAPTSRSAADRACASASASASTSCARSPPCC